MERNLQSHALIPGGVPADLEQPLHFVAQQAQTQVVQANQVTFADDPVETLMRELEIGEDDLLEDPGGKVTASASQWPSRVNWSADMAKLLVSAVAYVDDDMDNNTVHASKMRRMGKWSLLSSAMTKRGFPASPQQCADKFHDLNKRYRRVTEILGRGTACKIVEKPALLEKMKIPEKLKEEVRKQLSSKNLHYEQMCSYHNRDRVSLLNDPTLQKMLRRMARGLPVEQGKKCTIGDVEDDLMLLDEEEPLNDDMDVSAEEQGVYGTKKLKHVGEEGSHLPKDDAIDKKIIQIQKERLKIRKETKEMRQSHLERMKSYKEQEKELQKMRLDNEKMEKENGELERKIKEMEKMAIKPKRN